MTIHDEILKALDRYRSGCAKPDCLYAGLREHMELEKLAASLGLISGSPVQNESNRLEFHGMQVYRVDTMSFIGFGPAPSAQPYEHTKNDRKRHPQCHHQT